MLNRNSLRDPAFQRTADYSLLLDKLSPLLRDTAAGMALAPDRDAFGEYGILLRTPAGGDALTRLYCRAAMIVDDALSKARRRARTATRWRMASTIIMELADAPACPECNGEGILPGDSAAGARYCKQCDGTGRHPWSYSKRADECGAHHTDFRDRLGWAYRTALRRLADMEYSILAAARCNGAVSALVPPELQPDAVLHELAPVVEPPSIRGLVVKHRDPTKDRVALYREQKQRRRDRIAAELAGLA